MKITIVGRNDHSRYIADQYEKHNILGEYYNFYFFKNNILGKILKKINSNIEFVNKDIKIQNEKVRNLLIILLIKKIFKKLKISNSINTYITDNMYDLYVSLRIKEADYYHMWSQYSYFTIKKIKKKYPNAKIILDFYCAHPSYREIIYSKNPVLSNFKISEKYLIKKINKEIELSNFIVCPSEHIKESIITSSKKKEEDIKIIRYGSDYKNFYKIEQKKDSNSIFKILFVGQISGHKGINYLIEAVEKLNKKNKNIELILIGKKEGIYKNINFSENYEFIRYLGTVENNKLNKYYNEADLFVFPSLSESWGLVVSEAISAGLPVITTKNAKNLIKNLENGLIIQENNLQELIESIEFMYNNENFRENCRLNNLKISKNNNYSWKNYFIELKKIIIKGNSNEKFS